MVELPTATTTIETADGVELEARWDRPEIPHAAVVFCHPHPQYGGTMHAPLMARVTKELVQRGFAVLRFNFRGVGGSTGIWGGGDAEAGDVGAAMDAARKTELPVNLAGWSFGSAVSLRWQAISGDMSPWVGIAPPVGIYELPAVLAPARRTIIIGDRDQFVTVEEVEAYAATIGARVELLAGSDHFFTFRHRSVAEIMAEMFSG
jgi:alpha/beta superfamily hydrolase